MLRRPWSWCQRRHTLPINRPNYGTWSISTPLLFSRTRWNLHVSPPQAQSLLSRFASLIHSWLQQQFIRLLKNLSLIDLDIKWVNDLYLNQKKNSWYSNWSYHSVEPDLLQMLLLVLELTFYRWFSKKTYKGKLEVSSLKTAQSLATSWLQKSGNVSTKLRPMSCFTFIKNNQLF